MEKVQFGVCVSSSVSAPPEVLYLSGSGRFGRARRPPGVTGLMDENRSFALKGTYTHFKLPRFPVKREKTSLWRPERTVAELSEDRLHRAQ